MTHEPEWALATVLFADIRGFTSFAERATARETVDYLNAFFGVAVPVVEGHGGTVFQLLGDGLLAVFGAPVHLLDHADRAVAASAEMLDAVAAELGDSCRIGIGVNSGLLVTGQIGGGGHYSLNVIGDPVNVAARVQDATRALGEMALLTEATRCLLETQSGAVEAVGSVSLKGKSRDVVVHRLKGRVLR